MVGPMLLFGGIATPISFFFSAAGGMVTPICFAGGIVTPIDCLGGMVTPMLFFSTAGGMDGPIFGLVGPTFGRCGPVIGR